MSLAISVQVGVLPSGIVAIACRLENRIAVKRMAGEPHGTDALGELPDELPISQSSAAIEEDLFGFDLQSPGVLPARDVPDELPLSDVEEMHSAGPENVQEHSGEALPQHDALPESAGADDVDTESPVGTTTAFNRRRGRPNRLLQEALGAAAERLASTPGLASGTGMPRGPQVVAEASPGMSVAEMREQRSELLKMCTTAPADMHDLLEKTLGGLARPTCVAEVVWACQAISKLAGEGADESVKNTAEVMLSTAPLSMATKKVRAEALGMSYQKLDAIMPMLGTSILTLDRLGRSALEKSYAKRLLPENLLLYIDWCAYDETPLPTAVEQEPISKPLVAAIAPSIADASSPLPLCTKGGRSALTPLLGRNQGVQKILQTMQGGGLLMRLGDGRFVSLLPSTLCSLVILPDGTGESTAQAQMRISGVSRASTKFQQTTRAVCTDRAKANFLAERRVVSERGASWTGLHISCDVHRTSRIHDRTFSVLDTNIRGMVDCALSMRNGPAMSRFRKAMRDEIASRFVVLHGAPTAEAKTHKMRVLQLFVSHGTRLATRRLLLTLCPNGDWRNEAVEYYLPARSHDVAKDKLCEHLTTGVIAALCSCQPSSYPRHRWTGADLATDSLGIVEACHALLSTTYVRFAAGYEHASRARRVLASGSSNDQPMAQQHGLLPALCDGPVPEEDIGVDEGAADTKPADGKDTDDPTSATEEQTWALINAARRRRALEWLRNAPLPALMLQRLVMEPLRSLLAKQFAVASQEWEQTQRGKLANALGSGGEVSFADREYRLCLAAKGADEERCFEQLNLLLQAEEMWSILPRTTYTVSFRATAFRLISAAGCGVKQHLDFPHKTFPIRLFGLLADPTLAQELAAVPDCCLDKWSLQMKQLHPGFEGEELLHKLALFAILCWKDISQVEARHATIRRLLAFASLQTHQQKVVDLAVQWLCLQFRRRQHFAKGKARECPRPVKKVKAHEKWGSGSAHVISMCV